MKTTVLYIPGLGDRYDGFRRWALRSWKLWGVDARLVPITWYDGGSMTSKLGRISDAIGQVSDDRRLVLIGESAGASLALHAGAKDSRVTRVITLCGVARPDTPVSAYLRRRAPALNEGVNDLKESYGMDVHSVRAAADGVVGKRYSVIRGAKEHVIWSVGHLTTISLCLTVLAPIISAIAKKQK
jgi:pimeloyl-ACP methyl ester carboxylesterase